MALIGRLRQRLTEHRILLWVCLVIAVNQLGFGIIVPVTPIYARTFGVSEAAIGLVVAVYGLGRFLFSVPVGQAADRFGRRGTIFAGTLLTCAGSLLCGLADDFARLLLYRFIAGIGSTAVITGTQIVVADVATRENRGRMMGTYQGFFAFAVGVGPEHRGAGGRPGGAPGAVLRVRRVDPGGGGAGPDAAPRDEAPARPPAGAGGGRRRAPPPRRTRRPAPHPGRRRGGAWCASC